MGYNAWRAVTFAVEAMVIVAILFFLLSLCVLFAGKPDLHDALLRYVDNAADERGCP